MRTFLPTTRNNINGFQNLSRIHNEAKKLFLDNLEIDFSQCDFFEANMAAPFFAILSHIYDNLNSVTLSNIPKGIENILRKNQFLEWFDYSTIPDSYQTTFPFKKFKKHAGDQFSEYLNKYLQGRGLPQMSLALVKKFKQNVFEVFQNAAIHSYSDSGTFVCGQFFPSKHKIDFSIADAGIGIRDNVRRHLSNQRIGSTNAIQWALETGNTTKIGRNHPGGLGLKLIKDFIHLNEGKIQIISRFGFYEFSCQGETISKMSEDFHGTCVNIEFNTSDIDSYCFKSELTKESIF